MMISMACQTSHHCQETWKLRCHESAAAPGPFHKMWMLLSFIRFDFLMIRLLIYSFWSIYLFFELLSLYCCKCVSLQEKLKTHTSKSTFSCQHSSAKNKKYIFVCHIAAFDITFAMTGIMLTFVWSPNITSMSSGLCSTVNHCISVTLHMFWCRFDFRYNAAWCIDLMVS